VSFVLANFPGGGTGVAQTVPNTPPNVFDIPVNITNPGTVYTLINSAFGAFGATVGSVEFKATGGLDFSVNLVEGQNIRDHFIGLFNNTIGNAPLGSTYVQTFSFSGNVQLDEQAFVLPAAFHTATLTDIILNGGDASVAPGDGEPFLAAATVVMGSAVPEPTALVTFGLGIGIVSAVGWWRRRIRVS